MVRSDKNYPSVYFGRPGAFVTLPWPREGIDRSYERIVGDFETGSGQHIVSKLVNGSRPHTLSWRSMHLDTYRLLEQYHVGSAGTGPWALIDPSVPNMLLPNQAAATNLLYDTTGFSASSGVLSSNAVTANVHTTVGNRSLRWLWSSAPGATTPTLNTTYGHRSWYGYPVVPGLSYAWSSWIKPDSVDPNITVSMRLQWRTSTNGVISESTGGDIAVTAWTQLSCIAVAPATSAYVKPVWIVTGSTVAAGGSLYIDEPMLEQDTIVNAWAPGTGVKPMEIVSLSDSVPFNSRFRVASSMTLREVVK